MTDIERGPGRETPPDGGPRESADAAREEGNAGAEARAEASDARARREAGAERREAKERIADVVWERPKRFVERVIEKRLGAPLRRFLGKFGSLDDEAMASRALKEARDAAKREAERPEQG